MEQDSRDLIANRLKMFRRQNNLSQKDVAQKLNVDASTISYYENAKRSVPVDMLKDFARIYDTTLESIAGEVSYTPRHEYMAIVKEPVPVIIKNIKVNLLFLGAFLLLFVGVFFETEAFIVISILLFIVHGLSVLYIVFIVHNRKVKYYTYSETDTPVFVYKDKPLNRKNGLRFILYLTVLGLFGEFIATAVMTLPVVEAGQRTDEVILVLLFLFNTGFLIYVLVQILRKKLLPKTFKEEARDKRMSTVKFLVFKGSVLASFIIALSIYHYMGPLAETVGIPNYYYLVLVHAVHLVLYFIPFEILSMFRHYEMERKRP